MGPRETRDGETERKRQDRCNVFCIFYAQPKGSFTSSSSSFRLFFLLGVRGLRQFSVRRRNVQGTLAGSEVGFLPEPTHFPLQRLLEQLLFLRRELEKSRDGSG